MLENDPKDYAIEPGPMGAIGESQALMLRVNRNCPWNRCLFCPVYKDSKFSTRSVDELKRDIDAVRRTRDLIESASFGLGLGGEIEPEVLREVIASNPAIYGDSRANPSEQQRLAINCLRSVAGWLQQGAARVFLQDADALAMKVENLAEFLRYLKHALPSVATVTCYARSKSAARRSVAQLAELREAGLAWCFVGVESGNDAVLDYVKKGVTKKEHIEAGQKLKDAGIRVAAFVMPGLSGQRPAIGRGHIAETVDVLNAIAPQEVRVRSLAILEYALLYEKYKSGEFVAPTEDALVEEIVQLLEGIDFDCTIETLQMTNPVVNIKGPIEEKRELALDMFARFQALSPLQRAAFSLNRYVEGGYLHCVDAWGMYDSRLQKLIEQAFRSITNDVSDAPERTERAIFAIKSKIVP
jgi:histone acetyltransferase (RNA polymerase elongator complex component)